MLKDFIDYSKERLDSANLEGKTKKPEVPIWEKYTLTIEEAADYFRIGQKRLRVKGEYLPEDNAIVFDLNEATDSFVKPRGPHKTKVASK